MATIAAPKFSNTKEKAYSATMKGDLRNLAVSQEAYFHDNSTYYNGPIPAGFLTHNRRCCTALGARHGGGRSRL